MPETLTVSIDADGVVGCLLTDALDLPSLGRVRGRRASRVEWDDDAQAHVATLVDGTVVGRSTSRAECLAAEIAHLDGRIADGTIEALFGGRGGT